MKNFDVNTFSLPLKPPQIIGYGALRRFDTNGCDRTAFLATFKTRIRAVLLLIKLNLATLMFCNFNQRVNKDNKTKVDNVCTGKFSVVIGLGSTCTHNNCVLIGSELKSTSDYCLMIGNSQVCTSREMTDSEFQVLLKTLTELGLHMS